MDEPMQRAITDPLVTYAEATVTPQAGVPPPPPRGRRMPAIDWMRGLMVIFMLIDHASSVFNQGHLNNDSAASYTPGMPLPPLQFLSRWIAYLTGGPATFFLTAGAAIAFYIEKNRSKGAWAIDRFLLTRGAFLAILDPTLITWLWGGPPPRFLQVLFALGVSMMSLTLLRRLSSRWLVGMAAAIAIFGEAVALTFWSGKAWNAPLPLALTLGVAYSHGWMILYPLLPWLSMMALGLVCGRKLIEFRQSGRSPERFFVGWGLGLLAVLVAVRGLNGYGNMLLYRSDNSLIQWVHVSKYPPSLSYIAMCLGLAALCFAALWHIQQRLKGEPWRGNPLLVFGRTPLFFYLIHWPILIAFDKIIGPGQKGGLGMAYGVSLLAVALLYPLCLAYDRYKSKRTYAWLSYL
jgi:uncharacterized membrane protein